MTTDTTKSCTAAAAAAVKLAISLHLRACIHRESCRRLEGLIVGMDGTSHCATGLRLPSSRGKATIVLS